jgi:hypothetical protein
MRSIELLFFCAVLLLSQSLPVSAADSEYLAELIAKSRRLQLSENPEWHKLVHYVPNNLSPGVHGLVDSPRFYNAKDGKQDPQAELEATLASFYSLTEESNEQQNPQCQFVARYTWLNEQLAFDPQRLPRQACRRFQKWFASLNPAGITLIFASAYLNSPSSMYGHTLIRVDAKDQDEHTRLLAYAINFAANANETNGVAFAVNGLFGGYPGAFSILPYYAKVREYSDLENRDIWEYELNLTHAELERVLMHAWELGSVYFQYFFFDENCSYHLLGLLQVAQPELDLTGQFRWWAIPSDTVRAIASKPGLVKKTVYRPANATVLAHKLGMMSEGERRLAWDLSMRQVGVTAPALSALPDSREAAVIEASQDYVSYLRATEKINVADSGVLAHELFSARSALKVAGQTPEIAPPQIRPDQGHGSSRIALGAGRRDRDNFQELRMRGTHHEIMDTDGGYARGAQIEFFNIRWRHYDSGATRVEEFMPVKILSLAPRDDFFRPMSWKIEAGWQRARLANGREPPVFMLNGGAGGAWSNQNDTALWYAMFEGGSRVKGELVNGYALGAGPSIGGLFDFGPRWRVHGFARGVRYFMGQHDTISAIGLEQRFALGRDLALRLDVSRNRELQRTYGAGSVAMLLYF